MFDPEKIERFDIMGDHGAVVDVPEGYVKASDYDLLLADRNRLKIALGYIIAIPHKLEGGDWDEIEEAQSIALSVLGKQTLRKETT